MASARIALVLALAVAPAAPVALVAQVRDTVPSRVPLPPDTTPAPRDSVKAPIAAAPRAASPEVQGRRVTWDRDALFASGAMTLAELLALVPGVTTYHAGFMASVSAGAWYGEPGRIRLYLDGLEVDPLDPRAGGVQDLTVIPIWPLEEVSVERTAGELRVHMRTWRVRLTTAETRTDIVTGSENTNLYRGFFGKRSDNGAAVQLAAQQFSTTSARTRGDGDGLSAFARLGVARGKLSIDGSWLRAGRTRAATIRDVLAGTPDPDAIAPFEGRDVTAYLRAAWGDADRDAAWVQLMAATMQHQQDADEAAADATPPTDFDTTVVQSQYVASAGVSRWGARVSATGRLRVQDGEKRFAPSVRASWDNRWISLNAFAEEKGPDSTSRQDVGVLVTPLRWLHLAASHSIQTPDDQLVGGPARTTSRAEAGVRLFGRWVVRGGMVERSSATVQGMPAFDGAFGPQELGEARGIEGGLSGPIWGPVSFDWRGVSWEEPDLYRVPVESRAELRVASAFLSKFPRNNFHLYASIIHEYRGPMEAPDGAGATRRAEGAGVFSSMLEIRIGTAHIFWYNRNYNGKIYETVPGYLMPRMVQLYGVRWAFWN